MQKSTDPLRMITLVKFSLENHIGDILFRKCLHWCDVYTYSIWGLYLKGMVFKWSILYCTEKETAKDCGLRFSIKYSTSKEK